MNTDKEKQFLIINKHNPLNPNLGSHTWITSPLDIKTYEEAWEEEGEVYDITPDFSKEDAENALKNGVITVYSSYPIKQGTFVTPSRMEASNYAGTDNVYSKVVRINDVAWIDQTQGQYANLNENSMKKIIRLTEQDLHNIISRSVKRAINERIKGEMGMTDDEVMRRRNRNFEKDVDYVPNRLSQDPYTPNYTDKLEMEAPYHTPEEMELKVAKDRLMRHKATQKVHKPFLKDYFKKTVREAIETTLKEGRYIWGPSDDKRADTQFRAVDRIKELVSMASAEGKDINKEASFLLDKCRHGDIYKRISWQKLLSMKTPDEVIRAYQMFQ